MCKTNLVWHQFHNTKVSEFPPRENLKKYILPDFIKFANVELCTPGAVPREDGSVAGGGNRIWFPESPKLIYAFPPRGYADFIHFIRWRAGDGVVSMSLLYDNIWTYLLVYWPDRFYTLYVSWSSLNSLKRYLFLSDTSLDLLNHLPMLSHE